MTAFRDLSLKRKLTLLMTLSSGGTLLLTFAAMLGYELVRFREGVVRNLDTSAQIIGTNVAAALAFPDQKTGGQMLGALAAVEPVTTACIYGREGRNFAQYL